MTTIVFENEARVAEKIRDVQHNYDAGANLKAINLRSFDDDAMQTMENYLDVLMAAQKALNDFAFKHTG